MSILCLPPVSEEDVMEAVRYFRRRYGLTPQEKKARDDQLWQLQWLREERRIDAAIEARIRRSRYK